jgi:glycosyltransferase involved in cell wall biosynthesis
MKIVHIIPDLRKGGAERLAIDIIRQLSTRKGVTCALVLFRNEIEYNVNDITSLIKVIPSSVTLSVLNKTKYNTTELQKFIDIFQPDVIHSIFEAEIVSRSLSAPKAKWFSHCHWNTLEIKKTGLLPFSKKIIDKYVRHFVVKTYIAKNNRFIAISLDTLHYYRLNLPELSKNIIHIPNAIDTIAFKNLRPQHPILQERFS